MPEVSLPGYIKNNVVIFDKQIQLPDGIKVSVIVSDSTVASSGLCGIWKDDRPATDIVNDIIASRTIGREPE